MAKYNIPLYGANKDGGDVGDFMDFLQNFVILADVSFHLEGNTGDQTIYSKGDAEGAQIWGGFVETSACTIDATGAAGGDYQANAKVGAVSAAPLTTAGVNERQYFGGGEVVSAETVLLESTGSAGNSADVRIVLYGCPSVNLS